MAKVYCKGCQHIKKITLHNPYGFNSKTLSCFHDACFQGEVIEVDAPIGRKKINNRERIADTDMLNASNDCRHFKQRRGWLDFIKGKKPEHPQSVEIDTSETDLILQLAAANSRIENLIETISKRDKIVSRKDEMLKKQNNIIFRRTEKAFPSKKGKTVFDKIDLD